MSDGAGLLRALAGAADAVAVLSRHGSTHELAVRLLDQLEEEDQRIGSCLLIALEQPAGRGRGERSWASPPGGLYLNWLRSEAPRGAVARLPLIAGAAAVQALEAAGAPRLGLKWPNDVLLGTGKLAGLLSHARHGDAGWITVAMGVNLLARPGLADPPPRPPVALADHVGPRPFVPWAAAIAEGFVRALEAGLQQPEPAVALWRERLVHRPGERLVVRVSGGPDLEGGFIGLTDEGHLRLATEDGERVVTSGDVMG